MFYKKLILILKTCLSVFFKTSSEGPYLNREFRSKPFDAQTEKGNFNNFGANDKSGVEEQYTPLNTNFNETSPLATISEDSHPHLCKQISRLDM